MPALLTIDPIHVPSVMVAALLSVALAHVWFSPFVFGIFTGRALVPKKDADTEQFELYRATLYTLGVHFLFFYTLAYVIAYVRAYALSLKVVTLVLVLLVTSMLISLLLREKQSLPYSVVYLAYTVVMLAGGISIITFWPW